MRYTFAPIAFGLGASAAVLKRHACSFEMQAKGPVYGPVGQIADGQCRIGGGHSPSKFHLEGGYLKDDHGRGCIITGTPYQIQCDHGKTGTHLPYLIPESVVLIRGRYRWMGS